MNSTKVVEMPRSIRGWKRYGKPSRKGEITPNTIYCLDALVNRKMTDNLSVLSNPNSTPVQKRSARFMATGILAQAFGETCVSRKRFEIQFAGGKLIWEPNRKSKPTETARVLPDYVGSSRLYEIGEEDEEGDNI